MANTFIIALLLLIYVHRLKSDCTDTVTSSDCGDFELCSKYDLQCYPAFKAVDYDSISLGDGPFIGPYTDVTGYDLDLMVDSNASTSVEIPGDSKWYQLQFIFPSSGYYVHGMSVIASLNPAAFALTVNGQSTDSPYSGTWDDSTPRIYTITGPYPTTIYNVSFITSDSIAINWYSVNVYGAYSTPIPSESPTKTPTDDTSSPTPAPSASPSTAPSLAPTAYPTPDVCEAYVVKQPCCGRYGFIEEEDKINLRDPTLLTCQYTFSDQCCGTKGGWGVLANKQFYGCDAYDNKICDPSFYNTSLNTTDKLYGPVISTITHLDLSASYTDLLNPDNNYCTCNWTVYECKGTDRAVCGTMEEYDNLFDMDCWGNETLTYDNDFSNESCWKETVANNAEYEHLLWEPCGIDSFIGDVTDVVNVTNEIIHQGKCTCLYRIRDCHVLEDQSKTACDKQYDCINDGQCEEELAKPCCGYEDYSSVIYQGVTASLDANKYPIDGSWTCNNNESIPLCPDIFEATRLYQVTPRIDWWYDMDTDEINSRCGCLYVTDECNLPTSSPSTDPTKQPSKAPTAKPTEEADHVSTNMVSYITILVIAMHIISLFV